MKRLMKKIKFILVTTILISLFACKQKPIATFSEPQPANTENLSKFPKRLQGQYLSVEDNSILSIDDKLIQRIYDFDYKIHPNQLDSTERLVGDTVINLETNEKTIIKRNGDSLVVNFHHVDTLFQMDYDNVVRKFKGYYFLNTRYGKQSWGVEKMQLSKRQLVISNISVEADIEKLKEITETLQDTILPYKFSATKKQFKNFVKNEGCSDSEIFIKQK
jgi:hypothetical protein